MHTIPDITFIGGGISGLLSARLFTLAGAKVTIIEKNQIGQESSWAGGGILFPLYAWQQADAVSQLIKTSIHDYPALTQALIDSTGIDPEYTRSGLLITQLDNDLAAAQVWCKKYDIYCTSATQQQKQQFPQIQDNSLWLESIAQVRNPRLLKSLKQDLLQRGVTIIENCAIETATIKNNRIQSIASSTRRYAVNQLVITSGAWTGELWKQLFLKIPENQPNIQPVKGQMLIFDTPKNTLNCMVLEKDRYLIPRRDGKILCGSSVEHTAFNKTTTEEVKQSLAQFAKQLFPALNKAPIIHHWAGLRPGTPQGIPYIDQHPEISNLAVNAGHFRNGFGTGLSAAQLLYELLTQQATSLDPVAYQLTADH